MEQPQRKETYKHGKETSSFICIHQFFFIFISCQSTRTEFENIEREHSKQIARIEQSIYNYGNTVDEFIKSISNSAEGMGGTITELEQLFERYYIEVEFLLSRYKQLEQYCRTKGYKDKELTYSSDSPNNSTYSSDSGESRSLYP